MYMILWKQGKRELGELKLGILQSMFKVALITVRTKVNSSWSNFNDLVGKSLWFLEKNYKRLIFLYTLKNL